MNYSFHPEAEKEFLEAIEYYEGREENLGFVLAVMHLHRDPDYWKHRIR
jgi:hypothetical protein